MDMNQAAIFLSGSILTMLGFIVVVGGIIIVNNMLHKYWKPVRIWRFADYPPTYQVMQSQEEVDNERPQEKRNERS